MNDEVPNVGELVGYIAYDLAETYKEQNIDVESWEMIGEIELSFPNGNKYRITIDDISDE